MGSILARHVTQHDNHCFDQEYLRLLKVQKWMPPPDECFIASASGSWSLCVSDNHLVSRLTSFWQHAIRKGHLKPSSPSKMGHIGDDNAGLIITDLTICLRSPSTRQQQLPHCGSGSPDWRCLEKDLYLHEGRQLAFIHAETKSEQELKADDLVLTDIWIGEEPCSTATVRQQDQ